MTPSPETAAPLAARSCRMQGRRVYLEINDRRVISFPAARYALLEYATQVELQTVHLQDEGRAIGWTNIDEVIRVEDVARNVFVHSARAAATPSA